MPKINVNGVNIHYEISGQGPALILLHGWTENCKFWKLQIPDFSKYFRVIAVDFRGHGESDKPETGYSMRIFADDLRNVFDGLGIEKATIVGHSLGGMTALVFCLKYPERVNALILANTTSVGVGEKGLLPLQQVSKLIAQFGFENVTEQSYVRVFFAAGTNEDLTKWAKLEVLKTPQYAVVETMKAIMEHNVTEELSKITIPTLIIHSTQDNAIGVKMAKVLAEKISNSALKVLEGAGHHTMLEKPDEFRDIVLDFLRRLEK